MTRILIYLLALLTGFSAAEAARPVHASPLSFGSASALDAAVSVGEVAQAKAETCIFRSDDAQILPRTLGHADDAAAAPACVYRSDRARQ